ncbi:hypothetical protein KIW84_055257 [Lathyrus oleraceus]|uniref:Uncharacterized protein n=1 Tax=Pisum sativum TaxID=3888 RepID=A0A9D5AJJ2_PEA|nr:hypothetical protein KIW84_055257 [Pisum sativum]
MGDDVNVIVSVFKPPKRVVIQFDSRNNNNVNRLVSPLVTRLAGPVPYSSDKVVPYKYNSTMIDNGQEVPLPVANSMVNIVDVVKVTHSGRVFTPVFSKVVEEVSVGKKAEIPTVDPISAQTYQASESSKLKANDDDEVLRLIKTSEFNVVEKLLQTPSKISMLSLLMNFEAHREALQRVLEQDYIEHDVTVDQFDHIVANITSCNSQSFSDEELQEEGRNHNLALHISMNCKEDALSNVLVDTGLSLNVLPKSTLARLSYQISPMRYSGVVVKAFDGSRKTVIGEVDLPVKIGPSDFQITFQKLKFVKNDKLVVVGSEEALLDAKEVVQAGSTDRWGHVVEVLENKNKAGLGFQQGPVNANVNTIQLVFQSGGFIHKDNQHSTAIIEDHNEDEVCANFVTHGQTCNNWVVVDVPVVMHRLK